jgi:uncharacterized protein YxeA
MKKILKIVAVIAVICIVGAVGMFAVGYFTICSGNHFC